VNTAVEEFAHCYNCHLGTLLFQLISVLLKITALGS
jgi:hypothetical protein